MEYVPSLLCFVWISVVLNVSPFKLLFHRFADSLPIVFSAVFRFSRLYHVPPFVAYMLSFVQISYASQYFKLLPCYTQVVLVFG